MRDVVEMSPGRFEYHVRLGEWLIRSGNLGAALRSMEDAERLAPTAVGPKARIEAIRRRMHAAAVGKT